MPTQWQAEHREQLATYARERKRARTPEQRAKDNARMKRWCAEHRAQLREKANARRRYRKSTDPAYLAKVRAERRDFYRRNPEKERASHRRYMFRKKFGITVEQYEAMAAAQGGVCAICKGTNSRNVRLPVDHDHKTGNVRGLLCERCNMGIGQFGDDPALLLAAIAYLAHQVPK